MFQFKIRHIILSALLSILGVSNSFAQRKSPEPLDTKTRLEAEFYFTEGEKFFILEDYNKARVMFEKSAETDPGNATAHYKLAQIHRLKGEQAEALEEISIALEINNQNKYYHAFKAELYTDLSDFDRAAAIYESMIETIDGTDEYLFELAAIYLYQQKFDKAIAAYDQIEKHYGVSEEISTQRQMIYLQTNNLEKAIEEGEKMIDTFPEQDKFAVRQVELLLNNGLQKEATAKIPGYVEKFPQSAKLRLIESELNRASGNIELADEGLMEAFKSRNMDIDTKIEQLAEYRMLLSPDEIKTRAIPLAEVLTEVHPESAQAYAVKGDLHFSIGEKREAKASYLSSLEYDDSNLAVWQNVLQMLLEENKMDSVVSLSEEALEVYPNQGMLYYFNGTGLLQQQSYKDAVYSLERGKRLSNSNLGLVSVFNSMLGSAYNGLGDYEKSDRAFEAALDYDPENLGVLNNYSYYLALRNESLDKAENMAARAVGGAPDNVTFLDTYGWVLYKQEKYKDAAEVMENAIRLGNVSAIHYAHYGDILFKLGDINGAVEQWKKAKELNPGAPLLDKKIAEKTLYE